MCFERRFSADSAAVGGGGLVELELELDELPVDVLELDAGGAFGAGFAFARRACSFARAPASCSSALLGFFGLPTRGSSAVDVAGAGGDELVDVSLDASTSLAGRDAGEVSSSTMSEPTPARAYILALADQARDGDRIALTKLENRVRPLIGELHGNVAGVARRLGVSTAALWRWLEPGGPLARLGAEAREHGLITRYSR